MTHEKEYVGFGLLKPLEDPTPSENVLVSIWIPKDVLHDWDNLPERERHEIGRQVLYFISMKVAQSKKKTEEPKEELLRLGD
jgi:heme-degrading monooxygenase HmoA